MRNKNFSEGNHKKVYFAALFTCLLVVGVFAGINQVGSGAPEKNIPSKQQNIVIADEEPSENVSANKNAPPKITASNNDTEAKPKEELSSIQNTPVAESAIADPINKPVDEEIEVSEVFEEDVDAEVTASFGSDLILEWPLEGNIVMDYSKDKAIYDVTLEQYRTNDSVSIGAETGSQVRSAGDGVVEFVGNDSEDGNTIVINHNNGWKTTYSQLQDGILVNKGDNVNVGQVIGGVGNPTKYSILLGSHLEFKISRDDTTVDPKVALAR